jgi:hypothetical protein
MTSARIPSKRIASTRILLLACLGFLVAACSQSDSDGPLDTSRLPKVSGAKVITSTAQVTIFTSPNPVPQTADAVAKALTAEGWQRYVAPHTAYDNNAAQRMMSLKKGMKALSVFVTTAPAQNNATSVQYAVLPLKTDLPFTKDAANIEYSPERPLLALTTAQPVNDTLDFYRKELSARGWSLWSSKAGAKQAAGGTSGVVHRHGAYAEYVSDKEPSVVLVVTAQNADAGKSRIELKEWPIGTLKTGRAVQAAPQIDVTTLPRLDGAVADPAHSLPRDLRYTAPGSVEEVSAAAVKMLAANGWQQFVSPSETASSSLMFFKKGPQGLTVSLSMSRGQATQSALSFSPAWIYVDVPLPDDASEIVFNEGRPYLSCLTGEKADTLRDFYANELGALGWVPLTAAEAAAHWPDAKLGGKIYYTREKQKPILLSFTPESGGKTRIEARVAPFALPQVLEVGEEIYGLPRPKEARNAGGTSGQSRKEMHAGVLAEPGPVLAFYRSELGKRGWKEESEGAAVNADGAKLNFTSPEGPAVLEIGHRYDLTNVSLVQEITKPAVKAEAMPSTVPAAGDDPIDAMMKQAQQMVKDATSEAIAGAKAQKPAYIPGPMEALRRLAGNTAPVPVPDTAADVEFNGEDGRLEFNSTSSVSSVAEFYRSAMKQQGWRPGSSVINNANMSVLEFSKAGKSVSITVMKMGPKTNVSADGSGLKTATKSDVKPAQESAADTPSPVATEDDLIVEESGGLPMPKRHTLSVGDKSPFRRELNANVPLDLATVLAFYRRELGKRNWKEQGGAVVAADNAKVAFTSEEGPGLLKLGRKDGETTVNLTTRNPGAALKAGITAKPGRAKLLISNPNETEAVLVINKQTIKAPAGSGIKGPDGAMVELAPGKYKFTVKLPGKPVSQDEISLAADETWGLLIGPGGALPLHVY